MKSEILIRGLLRWLYTAVVLSMLGSLFGAAEAQAQVKTFFVVVPDTLQGEELQAYQECAERLNAALANTGSFRAEADVEKQRTVSSCIGAMASTTAKDECELSMSRVSVDWLLTLSSRRIGGDWMWGAAALSPAEGADQLWDGDEMPAGIASRVQAASEACDLLGKKFACDQGVATACATEGRTAGATGCDDWRATGATGCGDFRYLMDCAAGFVRIAPGTFMMGSPESEEGRFDNEWQHSVTITRAYCMKATEVTQGEWQAVMGSNPSNFTNCGANCPVEQVSWDDAVGYANALSRREGLPECYSDSTFSGLSCKGYRLPTEAEWEYAVRAGTTGATYAGNITLLGDRTGPELGPIAWYGGNSGVSYEGAYDCSAREEKELTSEFCGTHPVGQKRPNARGLYDMLGNVWEWTGDWDDTYPGTVTDPTGPTTGSSRVIRGGSWYDYARNARAADRYYSAPGFRIDYLGFRLSRTAP